jgi:acyl-CoA synthetase (NDP forming)
VAVFENVCRQANAIRVDSLDEMIVMLVALRFGTPLPRGRGVAVFGGGGGPCVLASDELADAGLELPRLSSEVQAELGRSLPVDGSILSNPVDTTNLATPEAIATAVRILGQVPEVDMLLYHLGFHPISRWGHGRFASPAFLEPVVASLLGVRERTGKPVLLALRPPLDVQGMDEFLAAQAAFVDAELPVFHSLRAAARAVSRVAVWNEIGARRAAKR